jgi:hypothetical protein
MYICTTYICLLHMQETEKNHFKFMVARFSSHSMYIDTFFEVLRGSKYTFSSSWMCFFISMDVFFHIYGRDIGTDLSNLALLILH